MDTQIKPEVKKPEVPVIEVDKFNWIVPQCCREGWASCKHVPKRQRKSKTNVGM